MKREKIFTKAVFILFLAFSLLPASASAGKVKEPQPVTIENTSVAVTVGNTSLPVTIQNTPITIETVPLQPFQWNGSLYFDKGTAKAGFAVPAGKRLAIEYISGNGTVHSPDGIEGMIDELSVTTNAGGSSAKHYLMPVTGGWSAAKYLKLVGAAQTMRFYADPETPVDVYIHADGGGNMSITLSGYLVDVK